MDKLVERNWVSHPLNYLFAGREDDVVQGHELRVDFLVEFKFYGVDLGIGVVEPEIMHLEAHWYPAHFVNIIDRMLVTVMY